MEACPSAIYNLLKFLVLLRATLIDFNLAYNYLCHLYENYLSTKSINLHLNLCPYYLIFLLGFQALDKLSLRVTAEKKAQTPHSIDYSQVVSFYESR
jgi:hypothetical protein